MSDYIEKLDNTFIYPPHSIPKPIQQQILLRLNINRYSHNILIKISDIETDCATHNECTCEVHDTIRIKIATYL